MMLCRNGKKVLPFPIERGLTRMTDNQQQPYGSDSVPQPAQPAQPAQPSYGQDTAQQPQGYGAPQPAAYAQPAAGSYGRNTASPPAHTLSLSTASRSFLGGLGVHNFYLGNTGKAVAQLLLTLVGWILLGLGPIAAAIWGFVEGIIILCSKPGSPWHKDANGYELSD